MTHTTFDEMYPDAVADFETESIDSLPPVLKLNKCSDPACPSEHKCEICDKPTTWANTTTGLMVCSPKCNGTLWHNLFMTLVAQQIVRGP